MTNVPLLDLGPQNRALEAQFENAFREVLRSNMFIMGPRLEAFEGEFERIHAAITGTGPAPVTLNDARQSLELIEADPHVSIKRG